MPYCETFSDYSPRHIDKYKNEGRNKRIYLLLESPEASQLVSYIKNLFGDGLKVEENIIPKTKMHYLEIYIPFKEGVL